MDKKNTMLLTVIAVATLLVAVVGATFAYFSVTGSATTSTSTGTVQTESVGVVSLSGNNVSFGVSVTAEDMSEANKGTSYYSVVAASFTAGTSAYKTSATSHTIATATVSGGSATASYACTFTLTATVDGTMATGGNMASGDATLVLSGLGITASTDIATIIAAGNSQEYSGNITLTGADATSNLTGYLVFNNTTADQTELAGTTLTVTLSIDNWNCDTTTA